MDNEILNYKDLAALPKIKAIYEVQRPDLISYEPYHRYTSDETLERYSYGEVLSRDVPRAGPPSGDMAWGFTHLSGIPAGTQDRGFLPKASFPSAGAEVTVKSEVAWRYPMRAQRDRI